MRLDIGRPADRLDGARLAALYVVFLAKREDLLDLDARRRVYQHVSAYPGTHLREVARALDLETNHAKYHLQYLEKHDLVTSRREGGYLTFFARDVGGELGPREVVDAADKKVLTLLRRPVPLHVTLLLLDHGEMTPGELLEHVDVSASTLSYHLKKMEKSGAVDVEKVGRERVYRLADHDRILGLLVRYRPPDKLVAGFLEAWEALELE